MGKTPGIHKDSTEIRKVVGIYNMIANLTWSALLLTPIAVFCYIYMDGKLVWIFLIISLLPGFLPQSFFDSMRFGKSGRAYKKLGVRFVNRFTQNGDIINALIRKRYPGYKVISPVRSSITRLISQTYMFEKFHWILFLFFSLAMVYAFVKGFFIWAFVFLISNIVYNVYPAFLQQYIRVRLKCFQKRSEQ